VPWALLASDRDGRLEFAGPAILNPPRALRTAWSERMAADALIEALQAVAPKASDLSEDPKPNN
jgi:hypothetical protein